MFGASYTEMPSPKEMTIVTGGDVQVTIRSLCAWATSALRGALLASDVKSKAESCETGLP